MKIALTVQGRRVRLDIPEKTVFTPNLVGLLNASAIALRPGETVVDASTGSGIHAILCAKLGAGRVVACDVNSASVRAARRNARLNGVADRCEFIHGSFEKALARAGKRIDLVVSTLPNTPSDHRYMKERAMKAAPHVSRHLDGGDRGVSLGVRLVREAAPRLGPNGRLHIHVVDWSDSDAVLGAIRDEGLRSRVVARANIPVWGQRLNTVEVFRRKAARRPWRVRYADLPKTPGTGVRVVEAARRSRPARRAARRELLVEVLG